MVQDNTSLDWAGGIIDSHHVSVRQENPASNYRVAFNLICTSDQLGDITSKVVKSSTCVSFKITPDVGCIQDLTSA